MTKTEWARRAKAYLTNTLESNEGLVLESLMLHEPLCPEYEIAVELLTLLGIRPEDFAAKWLDL
jgi:hypothetical protein